MVPDTLAAHDLSALDMNNWDAVIDDLGLASIAKVYAGGFEPISAVFLKPDPNVSPLIAFLATCVTQLTRIRNVIYRVAPVCAGHKPSTVAGGVVWHTASSGSLWGTHEAPRSR